MRHDGCNVTTQLGHIETLYSHLHWPSVIPTDTRYTRDFMLFILSELVNCGHQCPTTVLDSFPELPSHLAVQRALRMGLHHFVLGGHAVK